MRHGSGWLVIMIIICVGLGFFLISNKIDKLLVNYIEQEISLNTDKFLLCQNNIASSVVPHSEPTPPLAHRRQR